MLEKEKGGGVWLARRAGQARKGKEVKGQAETGVGQKMEGEFFKFKFFTNSSFQIQDQFKSNSSIVSNILPYSNKNEKFC